MSLVYLSPTWLTFSALPGDCRVGVRRELEWQLVAERAMKAAPTVASLPSLSQRENCLGLSRAVDWQQSVASITRFVSVVMTTAKKWFKNRRDGCPGQS